MIAAAILDTFLVADAVRIQEKDLRQLLRTVAVLGFLEAAADRIRQGGP